MDEKTLIHTVKSIVSSIQNGASSKNAEDRILLLVSEYSLMLSQKQAKGFSDELKKVIDAYRDRDALVQTKLEEVASTTSKAEAAIKNLIGINIKYRDALSVIANDAESHAILLGKNPQDAIEWAKEIAIDALLIDAPENK